MPVTLKAMLNMMLGTMQEILAWLNSYTPKQNTVTTLRRSYAKNNHAADHCIKHVKYGK